MKKIFFCSLLSLLFISFWQTCSVFLPSFLNVFLICPVAILFSLQFLKFNEMLAVGVIVGIFIDSLSGITIGISSIACLIVILVLSNINMFLMRVNQPIFTFYMLFISFFYRLAFLFVNTFLLGNKTNFIFAVAMLGPVVDALIAPLFFFVLIKIFALFKAFEHHDQKGNFLA